MNQRVNPLPDLEKMLKEPKSYWLKLLHKYFLDNNAVSIQGVPSVEEHEKMAKEEKERIEEQIKSLGEEGLKEKQNLLEKAIEFNDREAPESMLTSVPIPSIKSIHFHNIVRHRTDLDQRQLIDLSGTPVYTYFDHVKSGFVYVSMHFIHNKFEVTSGHLVTSVLEIVRLCSKG